MTEEITPEKADAIWTESTQRKGGIHPFLSPDFPTIVCLCGSTRFWEEFQKAHYRETMAGRIVLSVGFYPHSSEQAHGEAVGCSDQQTSAPALVCRYLPAATCRNTGSTLPHGTG